MKCQIVAHQTVADLEAGLLEIVSSHFEIQNTQITIAIGYLKYSLEMSNKYGHYSGKFLYNLCRLARESAADTKIQYNS